MTHPWIAERTHAFDSSGIRKVFELAGKMDQPINLSIGQPDFDVPPPARQACIEAIESGKNGYTITQGLPLLRDKLQAQIDDTFRHPDRKLFVTSGTSGGLVLVMFALVNPGDEVILFDPYFVMYEPLIKLVGGVPVPVSTYPEFRLPLDRVAAAITPRTKMILVNSPGNPTGVALPTAELEPLAQLAARHGIALVSDEIYRAFTYDEPFVSPAQFNPETIVIDGFSKSHAMTGWRVGYVHGPAAVIDTMTKLQQFTFVCAPQPAQWASAVALDVDISGHVDAYRRKRDRMVAGLSEAFEIVRPGGAFYLFPRAPWGTATQFVEAAIRSRILVIPGKIFSHQDTHFRISYAAPDETLERGIAALVKLARRGPD